MTLKQAGVDQILKLKWENEAELDIKIFLMKIKLFNLPANSIILNHHGALRLISDFCKIWFWLRVL